MEGEEDGLTILGDDLDAILDVLEQDEFLQEEFSAAVNSVSAENLIFFTRIRDRTVLKTCTISMTAN